MKITTLLFTLLLSISSFAQRTGDVVIYNNSGYQFHVVLNGIKQNAKAESNVRIQGLEGAFYGCLVIADDNTFSIEKNIIVKSDTLITYQITNKKGKYKLRFFSEVPMAKAPQTAGQSTIVYHTEEIPTQTTMVNSSSGSENVQMNVEMNASGSQPNTGTQTTQTVTTTTTVTEGNSQMNTGATNTEENVSISMSAGENGINVNLNVSGMDANEEMNMEVTGTQMGGTSMYQETTTTTTYSETTVIESGTEMETHSTSNSANPVTDCYISEAEANKAIQLIESETFADDQLTMAKALVSKKCLSVEQIGKIADILTFSDDRMELMKAAYTFCLDRDSYYQLLSKFTFSEDKEELQRFINEN